MCYQDFGRIQVCFEDLDEERGSVAGHRLLGIVGAPQARRRDDRAAHLADDAGRLGKELN